jgi:hypothetical protein
MLGVVVEVVQLKVLREASRFDPRILERIQPGVDESTDYLMCYFDDIFGQSMINKIYIIEDKDGNVIGELNSNIEYVDSVPVETIPIELKAIIEKECGITQQESELVMKMSLVNVEIQQKESNKPTELID